MQPCPNCGSMEINATGYCVHCGTFRGQQGYDQAFQPSAPPYGGQPSGPPYQSASYQQPYQAQQPYGGYPDPNYGPSFAPQIEPPHRRPSTVPLIVLSVVAVILVVGIVGVVLIRSSESGDGGNPGGNGGEPIAAGIDRCVVGKWRVTSAKEKVDDAGGETEFSATGGTAEFRGDGTGKLDYGSGVVYRGSIEGKSVTITLSGNISFDYTTTDNKITYTNVKPDGTAELKVDGATTTSIPLDGDAKPATYRCNGSTMTLGSASEQSVTELRKA